MVVDSSYYPIWAEQSDLTENGYAVSYTLKTLYDSQDSSLVFGDQMNNTNVYGYIDENSLLTQVSSGTFSTDINTTKANVYRGNLRLFWSFQSGQDVETKTGFDLISDANNTHFISDSGYAAGTNGYASYWLLPFVRLRYDQLCLYVRFRVATISKQTGSFTTNVYTLDEILQTYGQDLLDNGYTNNEDETVVRFIGGVVLQASLRTTNPTYLRYIYPYVEFNYNGNVYFGKPFQNALDRHAGWYFNNYLTYYGNGVYVSSNGNLPAANANYTLTEFCYGEDFCFGFSGDNEIDFSTFQYNECRIFDHIIVVKYPRNDYYSIGKFFTYDECLNMVSSLGLYFSFDLTSATTSALGQSVTDNNIYLGKMYEDGRCDGTYTKGTETKNELQAQTGIYIVTDRTTDSTINVVPVDTTDPFVPEDDKPIDDNFNHTDASGSSITTGYGDLSMAGVSGSTYVSCGYTGITALKNALANASVSTFWNKLGKEVTGTVGNDAYQLLLSADSGSILNYITSIRMYPFSVTDLSGIIHTGVTRLNFGYNGASLTPTGSSTGYNSLSNTIGTLFMGSVDIDTLQQEPGFWDYEPYTTISITLPCIGTFPLDAKRVIGRTLYLTYIVDLTTGNATANIYTTINDIDVPVLCKTGQMAINISMSGNDIITQAENIANAELNNMSLFINTATGLGNTVASKDLAGVATGVGNASVNITRGLLNASKASRDVPNTITSAGGLGSNTITRQAYITIRRPYIDLPDRYGHFNGFLIKQSYSVGSLNGYTVCSEVDTSSITYATAEERNMIYNILTTGFYA